MYKGGIYMYKDWLDKYQEIKNNGDDKKQSN